MRRGWAVVAALALFACETPLPVKYEICNAQGQECFITARFKDFDGCERVRQFGEMLCDRSQPGSIVCRSQEPGHVTISTSHCTR